MSDVTLKNYASRLGIYDSETIKKSVELLRLINLKLSSTITNQTAKLILCIECASIVCGTDLDHRQAVKLSNLKEIDYNRQKDLIEKLLNLCKKLTLDEICAQLEINDRLKNDARQLFDEYIGKNSFYDDTNSAPILVMAIYQSLKLRSVKISTAIKAKLMQIGKLKPKSWKQLEVEWDNWIEKCKPLTAAAAATDSQKSRTGGKRHQNESTFGDDDEAMDTSPDDANDNQQIHTELAYEEWRDCMIAQAKAMIKAETQKQNQMN